MHVQGEGNLVAGAPPQTGTSAFGGRVHGKVKVVRLRLQPAAYPFPWHECIWRSMHLTQKCEDLNTSERESVRSVRERKSVSVKEERTFALFDTSHFCLRCTQAFPLSGVCCYHEVMKFMKSRQVRATFHRLPAPSRAEPARACLGNRRLSCFFPFFASSCRSLHTTLWPGGRGSTAGRPRRAHRAAGLPPAANTALRCQAVQGLR
jgi:hypothetical protein